MSEKKDRLKNWRLSTGAKSKRAKKAAKREFMKLIGSKRK